MSFVSATSQNLTVGNRGGNIFHGDVSEWFKVPILKIGVCKKHREFESTPSPPNQRKIDDYYLW